MDANTYTPGAAVPSPGDIVGKTAAAYDTEGRVYAGIVLAARYEGERLLADVAVANDQSRPGRPSTTIAWITARNLELGIAGAPQPRTFTLQ